MSNANKEDPFSFLRNTHFLTHQEGNADNNSQRYQKKIFYNMRLT